MSAVVVLGSVTLTETLELTIDIENELESIAIEDINTSANTISELAKVAGDRSVNGISLASER